MRTRLARKLLFGGLGLAVLACLWLYFAPVGLGGSTTYVVTDGISMEPRFHTGDLAVVRAQGSYHVGEIVAYHSKAFHTIVLHRIIAIAGDRYVFKGDNNNFVDFEHPARSQLIGSLWLHIPGAGSRLQSLGSPQLVGILIGVATLLFCGAAFTTRRRRRRRRRAGAETNQPPSRRTGHLDTGPVVGVLAIAMIALLPFGALAALAFTRPPTALLPFSVPYKQSGTLSYTADTRPGPIYARNRAVTGEPLFTHVVNSVQLGFGYRFDTAASHSLTGKASLDATIASSSGWQTTFPLAPPTDFSGDHAQLDASLDLSSLLALVRRVQATTAVSGSYTLTLIPYVSVSGNVDVLPLHAKFSPQMQFAVNQLEVQPATPAGGSVAGAQSSTAQFEPTSSGSATGRRYQPNPLSLGMVRMSVKTARRIVVGGVAIVLCTMLLVLAFMRPRRTDEAQAILARHGRSIVEVDRVWQLPGTPVIDVADIDALVRIAEHYERTILFETAGEGDAFWVTDESGQFRYAPVGYPPGGAVMDSETVDESSHGLTVEVYADEQALGGIAAADTRLAPETVVGYSATEEWAPYDEPQAAVQESDDRQRAKRRPTSPNSRLGRPPFRIARFERSDRFNRPRPSKRPSDIA
ncbi:MAG TPA: signal peptidase I [Solirubrobacteraceae bacterium]|nr:signal peptidase I [Solirubrobacteraceae bacterium]